MTDGVYKSIEGQFKDEKSIDANKVLTNILMHQAQKTNPAHLADTVLAKIAKLHEEVYRKAADKDPCSPQAVNCRKRDDMTCVVYKFPPVPLPRTKLFVQSSTDYPNSAPPSLDK